MKMTYEGVLPIDKPAGWTSHDVVAKMRGILRERRIGHTGTLDPDVTGVLPLCVGRATRLVEYLQELPKEYEAELTIGYATDTEDASGQVTDRVSEVSLDKEQVLQTIQQFIGIIEQTPPMYSAVKKDGKRLYELAREGIEVERESRKVTIHKIQLLDYRIEGEFPTVRFRVRCSKGTYIRTLCVDIGKALGYPAVMSKLLRTETSGISLAGCYQIEEIARLSAEGKLDQAFIPVDRAIGFMPAVTISDEQAAKAANGVSVSVPKDASDEALNASEVRVFDSQGFIGIFGIQRESQLLVPSKVFLPRTTISSGR